nr:5-oxoprolinase subunit PxpB [Allomuricauda sp.]
MKEHPISIKQFGQRAVLLEWPNQVNEAILSEILGFTDCFKKLGKADWEMSVAYNSLTMVNTKSDIDFDAVQNEINECLGSIDKSKKRLKRTLWKLPVCYDPEFAIDLAEVSQVLALSQEELIRFHTSNQYTVYGIGFLPGFMYLGGLPEQLEIPRRKEPRLHVNKGSVGLAGKQTGIYPQDSPGGWNIIGSCPTPIFNPKAEEPCFVKVGDRIQFVEISRAEYDLKRIESEVGIYQPEKIALDA